jgi:hypothetical protein
LEYLEAMSKHARESNDDEHELIGIAHINGHGFGKDDPRYRAVRPFMPSPAVFLWPPAYARLINRCAAAAPSKAQMSFGLPSRWPNLWRLWLRRLVQAQQPESEVQLVASRRLWSLILEG